MVYEALDLTCIVTILCHLYVITNHFSSASDYFFSLFRAALGHYERITNRIYFSYWSPLVHFECTALEPNAFLHKNIWFQIKIRCFVFDERLGLLHYCILMLVSMVRWYLGSSVLLRWCKHFGNHWPLLSCIFKLLGGKLACICLYNSKIKYIVNNKLRKKY